MQQAGSATHRREQARESVLNVGASLRLNEGLVDNEIETLLGAVFAQGIDACHGNSPS
jgi:hypothetical protein